MRHRPLPCATVLALLSSLSLHCGNDDAAEAGSDAGGAKTHAGASGDTGGGTSADRDADASSLPEVGPPVEAGSPGQVDITFEIHANQGAHAISPYVYGVNDGTQAVATHATIVRTGGNRLTAYNWENNASNAGSDYEFENDDDLCSTNGCVPTDDTPGAFLHTVVGLANTAGAASVITVPIVDYVSADKSPAGDVRNSGANYLMTRFVENGAAKGTPFVYPPDLTDGKVFRTRWSHWLTRRRAGSASSAGSSTTSRTSGPPTHAEVHPCGRPASEFAQRNIAFADRHRERGPGGAHHRARSTTAGRASTSLLQGASDSQADGDFLHVVARGR